MVSHSLVLLGCIAGVQSSASNLSANTGTKNIQSHRPILKSASEENLNRGLHGQYHLISKGKYCEQLYKPIESTEKCTEAAKALGFNGTIRIEYHFGERFPTGCFIEAGRAYFNTINGGSASRDHQMVCEVGCVKYIGCYSDDWDRDLDKGPKAYGYDPSTCNTACKGYKYYALQNGGQCLCGDEYGTESQYVQKNDDECGDEGLGAEWRNSVFQTCDDWRCGMKYIGCFFDDSDRDLKEGPKKRGYNSSTCNTACKDYKYYALQDNGYCSCGDAYSREGKYVQKPDGDCGDHRLGGPWRNAVFQTGSHPCPEAGSYKFSLRGRNGTERVSITAEGITSESRILAVTKTEFVAKSSSIEIHFLNDVWEPKRDVFFQSNVPTTIEFLNSAKLKEWGCGGSSEDESCDKWRNGQFLWSGKYAVHFLHG